MEASSEPPHKEVFRFLSAEFDVARAKALVELGHAKLVHIDPHEFGGLAALVHITEEHVDQVDTTVPGIMVQFAMPGTPQVPGEIHTLLIDGWHRACKLRRQGIHEMPVHYLEDIDLVLREVVKFRRPGRPGKSERRSSKKK